LAEAKEVLQRKLGGKLIVAVVVTDDSPQEMWAVSGADVIFVPSNTTREVLLARLMDIGGVVPEVITVPYPISPWLAERLSTDEQKERQHQLKGKKLQVMVPISGAAVQLSYFQELIGTLTADDMQVTVVSRESEHTHDFLSWCQERSGVTVVADEHDPDVVAAYDEAYVDTIFGVEVTKPSEQAFKALFTPLQRGGSILLFSPPVGRQEKDNLMFLRRHKLIPSVDDQARLTEWCLKGNRLHITSALLERARHWRGVLLPGDGMWAGVTVKRLVDGGILAAMGDFGGFLEGHDEIRSDGVKAIWQILDEMSRK